MTSRLDSFLKLTENKNADYSLFHNTVKHSEFIGVWLLNNIDLLDRMLNLVNTERNYDSILKDIDIPEIYNFDEKDFIKHLRLYKMMEYTLITMEDITLEKDVAFVTAHISAFASAVLETAYRYAYAQLKNEFGTPVDEDGNEVGFCVIGLGKLGGNELNFSSDVDIMYVYGTEKGKTTGINGSKPIDNHVFFTKLGEKIKLYISERTADGMVYRVDLRLRPDGDRGQLVLPIRSYEIYYESYGQSWERMMLLKARTVAGCKDTGEKFIEAVKPFVFRRSLDFKLIDELKEVKAKINKRVKLKGDVKNVKLGYGGIREIEFIVQTFQILYSPKNPDLFKISTLQGLDALAQGGILDKKKTDILKDHYCFLRKLEHMVQIERELQTHIVPEKSDTFGLYLERCGFLNKDEFEDKYKKVTKFVNSCFIELFQGEQEEESDRALLIFDRDTSQEDAVKILKEFGIATPEDCLTIIQKIIEGPKKQPRLSNEQTILKRIIITLLPRLSMRKDPLTTLNNFDRLFAAPSTIYLFHDIFINSPNILNKVETIFSVSRYLTRQLLSNRNMLEYIYDPKDPNYDAQEIYDDFVERTMRYSYDIEMELETARIRHNILTFNIGYAYLNKSINVINMMKAHTNLTKGTINFAFDREYERMVQKYGTPLKEDKTICNYVIVGMGKAGSYEMSFGSDVDMVFLYEEKGITSGEKSVTNQEFFSKLVQRTISYLSTYTTNGFLYQIDMRLRPSGASGTLVTSIPAFLDYQKKNAMTWEKQALLKATVLNDKSPAAKLFYDVKHECLFSVCPVTKEEDVMAIHDMRMRIEKEKGSPITKNNLKAGYGGLIDIEFIVQMIQLMHGCTHESLRQTNTHDVLHEMVKMKLITNRDFNAMHKGYLFFRNLENLIRVYENSSTSNIPHDAIVLHKLASFFNFSGDQADKLMDEYKNTRNSVRAAYKRIMGRYININENNTNT